MAFALRLVFWACSLLTGYVYLLYPFLVMRLSRLKGRIFIKDDILPRVSIIITAYNEEKNIGQKIENTISLDYPEDRREIIVGSDGSWDKTNQIVKMYEPYGIKLLAFPKNRGKTMVQNDCAQEATGEVIIFMDAASFCQKGSLKRLVSNFADSRVGAVAGRIVFIRDKNNLTTISQGLYWRYEQILKRAEGSLGSLVGVDGPLYAIRKGLYQRLDDDMMSDFITPLLVIRDGRSVVYEPEAVTFEEATMNTGDELRTRRRIVTRGFTGLSRYPELMNPLDMPMLAWQILSHKILRWLVGYYYIGMLVSSFLLLGSPFFLLVFGGLSLILCLASLGIKDRSDSPKWLTVPYYFMLVNLAAALGIIDFLRGEKIISWKPVRG
jgi:cellulose synthase/poly-beta-1,6-N-acetylglucosamine synthase-like glycosyltransferase